MIFMLYSVLYLYCIRDFGIIYCYKLDRPMNSSFLCLPLPTSTLLVSIAHSVLRLTVEPHSTDDIIFISDKLHADNFPQELQLVFGSVEAVF